MFFGITNYSTMNNLKVTPALVSIICASGLVRAWDFGVVTETQIKLFSSRTADTTTDVQVRMINAAAYDPITKDIYVCDSYEKIFRVKKIGETYDVAEPIFAKRTVNVNGIAFDHLTSTLYWTTSGGIFYVRVPDNEITVPLTGQVLLKLNSEIPFGITIDVHRGFLYWANSAAARNATIERSRLDGSGRRVLARGLTDPRGITVDAGTGALYWLDRREDGSRSIHAVDPRADGAARTLVRASETWRPYAVAVDDRNVYWVDYARRGLWTMPKNSTGRDVPPTPVCEVALTDPPVGLFVLSDGDDAGRAGEQGGGYNVSFLFAAYFVFVFCFTAFMFYVEMCFI